MFPVAPQWIYEPHEISTLIGTPIKVHCAAKGFPIPQITWMKGQGISEICFLCGYII